YLHSFPTRRSSDLVKSARAIGRDQIVERSADELLDVGERHAAGPVGAAAGQRAGGNVHHDGALSVRECDLVRPIPAVYGVVPVIAGSLRELKDIAIAAEVASDERVVTIAAIQ